MYEKYYGSTSAQRHFYLQRIPNKGILFTYVAYLRADLNSKDLLYIILHLTHRYVWYVHYIVFIIY